MYLNLHSIISPEVAAALFQAIVHSLWQIPVIALGLKLIGTRRTAQPRTNYYISLASIILSICASGFTFFYFLIRSSFAFSPPLDSIGIASPISGILGHSIIDSALSETLIENSWSGQLDFYVVLIWIIGATLFTGRMIAGWIGIELLKKNLIFEVPVEIRTLLQHIKRQLGLNQEVQIAFSPNVTIPMVIGHLKPIVLLPLSTINQLTTEEVEAILIHELAHILQFDFIKNLVVMVGEALFFYHPVIWLLSSEIKEEREHCCDDIVMALCPDRVQYAKTLVKLEEIHIGNSSKLSMALFNSKFKLMRRIKRILNLQNEVKQGKLKLVIIALLTSSLIVFSSAQLIKKGGLTNDYNLAVPTTDNFISPLEKNVRAAKTAIVYYESTTPLHKDAPVPTLIKEGNMIISPIKSIIPKIISPVLDTLDKEEREKIRQELRKKRKELKEKTKEIRDKLRAQTEQIRKENREDLKKKRKEIHELRQKLREDGEGAYFDGDFDFEFDLNWDEEKMAKFSKKMEAWGAEFGEKFGKEYNDKFGDKFGEEWAEKLAHLGDELSIQFDDDWAKNMEDMGANMSEIFDEEWLEGIAGIGENVAASFDEEWLEGIAAMSADIAMSMKSAFDDFDKDDYEYNYTYGDIDNADKVKSELVKLLNRDGLLTDKKNSITITDQSLIINGQEQPASKLKIYQDIIKSNSKSAFRDGSTKVKFHIYGKSLESTKRTSLTVKVNDN